MTYAAARPLIAHAIAKAIAPRKPMRVSEWAERYRIISSKTGGEPGAWRNERNPALVEPMDCMSARSPVRDVVCMFPIQFGKSELELNVLGYTMTEVGGPIMVTLPAEVSMNKWIEQKFNPLVAECPHVRAVLSSTASRDSANRRTFKDFIGGQIYFEHAGNPLRLKQTSVRTLLVDEFSSFADQLKGDDPDALLDGRTSAFPATYKRLKVSSPGVQGICRTATLYDKSDKRQFHVPCPECGHEQPLEWSGLHWNQEVTHAWYACTDCGAAIEEWHKTDMMARGRWVAQVPGAAVRGYHINCLYYPMGLGPRWVELARMWLEVQNDAAKLKTFVNDRLAEPWEDRSMRAVKFNIIADRAEPLPLNPVPHWVLAVTAGIDTQDNRLPVQLVGWGRGMTCWPIDYVELPGDPAEDDVWTALTELLNRPIEHASGGWLRVDAGLQDILGHRTEAVKAYIRQRRVRRLMAGFGATSNNAPVLGKGRLQDVNWRGQYDKRGIHTHAVGTVAIKHMLYSWLSADADKQPDDRRVRFSDELGDDYFGGLVSETYNPTKNRFEKRRGGPRNEPLDTWVYAYAATHHPELRMHRWTHAQWDAREAQVLASAGKRPVDSRGTPMDAAPAMGPAAAGDSRGTAPSTPAGARRPARRRGGIVEGDWRIE